MSEKTPPGGRLLSLKPANFLELQDMRIAYPDRVAQTGFAPKFAVAQNSKKTGWFEFWSGIEFFRVGPYFVRVGYPLKVPANHR